MSDTIIDMALAEYARQDPRIRAAFEPASRGRFHIARAKCPTDSEAGRLAAAYLTGCQDAWSVAEVAHRFRHYGPDADEAPEALGRFAFRAGQRGGKARAFEAMAGRTVDEVLDDEGGDQA